MPQFLLDLFQKLTGSLFYMLRDLLLWIFDQFINLVVTLITALPSIDFSVLNPGKYFPSLPSSMINMMQYLHVDVAIGMIISALVIRLTLQLIPFTRLGS